MKWDLTYSKCLSYCPTGYTDVDCAKPTSGNVEVFCSSFNDFAGSWTDNSIELKNYGAYPAKHRGQYFQGSEDFMLFENNFTLSFNFSLFTWVRLDSDFGENATIFQKSDGSTLMMEWSIVYH